MLPSPNSQSNKTTEWIKEYSIKTYYEEFYFKEIQDIINMGFHYHAFALLAMGVEQLGRLSYIKLNYKNKRDEPKSKQAFCRSITVYDSLKKYKCFKTKELLKKPEKRRKYSYNNDLYKLLRCGMAHSFRVQGSLRLTSGSSNLNEKLIGCQDFYDDIKKAWEDLVNPLRPPKCRVDLNTIVFEVDTSVPSSGSTSLGAIKTLSVR